MKKIAYAVLATLILTALILFVPIPKGSYDDGGSREYEALTYKIIRWNRLSDRGAYRKTRIYWGADKHLSIDELFARESTAVANDPLNVDKMQQNSPAPPPNTVAFKSNTADVFLPIPDGWEYEQLDDGMRFWPQGHKQNPLRLYHTSFFGVCGTGLQCDTITLGGAEAEQGTYDNHTLWDYIVLPKEWYQHGDYVILNEGADVWWNDYGDEAMAILDGITFYEHVLPEEKAITFAKNYCTIEYNTIDTTYNTADLTWDVHFYTKDVDGGDQVVTIDAISGDALETIYGE